MFEWRSGGGGGDGKEIGWKECVSFEINKIKMINKHITKKTGKIGKFKIINAAILKITHKQERERETTDCRGNRTQEIIKTTWFYRTKSLIPK